MRTIDIFVSFSADVKKESAVAEYLIRSLAAELNVPIKVSYSNPLRRANEEHETNFELQDFAGEAGLVLRPCFWEHPQLEDADPLQEIPNTGQYDLVICILRSRLGTAPVDKCIMPDGSGPRSATDYEVAWILDQSKRAPGFAGLHVYRKRVVPAGSLEPNEEQQRFCRQLDEVQEFCETWNKNAGGAFSECRHDYQDLEDFEGLFREHFRDFLAKRLDRELGSSKANQRARNPESSPFRGLKFFDFEHSALYHGRTKAIWEVLDAMEKQASAKTPFVLVLGPAGSGKSSLVRAGVLPLLVQGGTPAGNGRWRRAVTRPGVEGVAGDPFDKLAAALLSEFAVPELRQAASPDKCGHLAAHLREDPDNAAARVADALNQLNQESGHSARVIASGFEHSNAAITPNGLGPVRSKTRLALVVDQLEDLFTGFDFGVQQRYIAALSALARCEAVFVIAALRSDFYWRFEQFPQFVRLTASNGIYELQTPAPHEIGNIIRFQADAAGLQFERDADTGCTLDQGLIAAAVVSPEPLPLLEHLLLRLYQRQLDRKDGVLRWSDYRELGELQGALARHAEGVSLTLKDEEHQILRSVFRNLVTLERGGEGALMSRTALYQDLITVGSWRDLAEYLLGIQESQIAKDLVDLLIKEELLSTETGPNKELLVTVPQEALLRRWPGVWQLLHEDQHFFRMRDRLDASLELWLSRGRRSSDLLDLELGLPEAEFLLSDFGSSLTTRQIEYIQKSVARRPRRDRVRKNIRVAAIAGVAILIAVGIVIARLSIEGRDRQADREAEQARLNNNLANKQLSTLETELKQAQQKAELARQEADRAINQRSALETELKKTLDEQSRLAQLKDDLAGSQRSVLETQLKEAEEKAQQAQQSADVAISQRAALVAQLAEAEEKAQQKADAATGQRSTLKTQLKEAQQKAQQVQQSADIATSQRAALEAQLREAQQKAQQKADAATGQRSTLETQLKEAQQKAQQVQQSADIATSQRAALEAQLREAQEKLQQKADAATGQRSTLETQLKEAQQKAQQVQQSADVAISQRAALEAQLREAQEKAQQAQQKADAATGQRSTLETQLKEAQQNAQQVQQSADVAISQRTALEAQLREAQARAQLAQQNADLATNQRSALETQLKEAEGKAQLAQQNADLASSQRSALETRLKNEHAMLQDVQTNADRTGSQLNALEAQLSEAQRKTQEAQSKADSAASELRGMRLGQKSVKRTTPPLRAVQSQPTGNDGNSEPGIGSSGISAGFTFAIHPEEKARLELEKYAGLHPPQETSSIAPSSSSRESETLNPPGSQSDQSAEVSGEEELLKKFVLGYLRSVASNDRSLQQRYLAERVDFYGRGLLNSSKVEARIQHYYDEWPIREWAPRGEAKVVLRSGNPALFVVYQPFSWTVSDGSHNAHGNTTLYLQIRKNSNGEFRIVNVHQVDR